MPAKAEKNMIDANTTINGLKNSGRILLAMACINDFNYPRSL